MTIQQDKEMTTQSGPREKYPTIFEKSRPGRNCTGPIDDSSLDTSGIEGYMRQNPAELPEVAEIDLVRHFIGLSTRNFGVDSGFYPLGSCTMKYNPKINDVTSSFPGFTDLHPYQEPIDCYGAMQIIRDLEDILSKVFGMDAFSTQPAAGAQGEYTGLLIIKSYLDSIGQSNRREILIPDSAHGTNPASAAMAKFNVVEVKSNKDGLVHVGDLKEKLSENTAGIMMTNPNTLGLFERNVKEIAELIHEAGGQLYYDGANANAISEIARPGDMGFDVIHLNLHKTFSVPHGGGGPGAGPVGVKQHLAKFLPNPRIEEDIDGYLSWVYKPDSIGRVKLYYGNFLALVRAYTYIRRLGRQGIRRMSESAVLNANYLRVKIRDFLEVPYDELCMHEFIASAGKLKEETGVSTMDIAKTLLDFNTHPPTTYFPLIVKEALMIEPTESESKETLDRFVEVMKKIVDLAHSDPDYLHGAPYHTPVRRLDDVLAARKPNVCFADWGCT